MVRDQLTSDLPVETVSRVHLHPDCTILQAGERQVTFNTQAGPFAIRFGGSGRLVIERSFYCPEFGKRIPNQALAWTSQSAGGTTGFCLAPTRQVDRFDVQGGARIGRRSFPW